MDMKKFNEEVDRFDLENIDMADIKMTELELKRIKKNAQEKCRVSKGSKIGMAAAVAGTIVIGGSFTPVIAENVPVVRDIFYELGLFKEEYKEHIEYIGETRTSELGEVTLDNLIVTDNAVLIGIIFKSNEPIDYDVNNLRINMFETDGLFGLSDERILKKIDEYTVAITIEAQLAGGSLIDNKKMVIEPILDIPISENQSKEKSLGKFEIKSEFKASIENREVYELDIDRVNSETKQKEIITTLESNVLGTSLYTKDKGKGGWSTPESEGYAITLKVDGKDYYPTGASSAHPTGKRRTNRYIYKQLKVDDIRNAKTIEIMVGDTVHTVK